VAAARDYWASWLRGLRPRAIHSGPNLSRPAGTRSRSRRIARRETDQWRALLDLLAADTADPDDCYFGLWEGWGFPESARGWPTFAIPRDAEIPARSYFLFHGSLSEAEIWGAPAQAGIWGRSEFSRGGTPAFVWPSDHAWCVAADIDPHWAGVGATVPSIERLVADRRLDAVEADPTDEQPAYR